MNIAILKNINKNYTEYRIVKNCISMTPLWLLFIHINLVQKQIIFALHQTHLDKGDVKCHMFQKGFCEHCLL